jgi:hypothetical protein
MLGKAAGSLFVEGDYSPSIDDQIVACSSEFKLRL